MRNLDLGVQEVPQAIEWDDEAFEASLRKASKGVIEASDHRVSSQQLTRLLDAVQRRQPWDREVAVVSSVDFSNATFSGDASLAGVTFGGDADFSGASFTGDANFSGASFDGEANFSGASFTGDADFCGASFDGDADFPRASFSGNADFRRASFDGDANFPEVSFGGNGNFFMSSFSGGGIFYKASFTGDAIFSRTTVRELGNFLEATFSAYAGFVTTIFCEGATFRGATFSGNPRFLKTMFGGDANFVHARFDHGQQIDRVLVLGRLWLDDGVFAERIRIDASAARASFARAEFRRGADMRLRWAELWLEDSIFAEPSLITGRRVRRLSDDGQPFIGIETLDDDGRWRCVRSDSAEGFAPRVLSVRGATVANLTLSGVNLENCLFAGAHGLDGLRLERVNLLETPRGSQRHPGWPVRWTRRRTIAEEHQWRMDQRHAAGWDLRENRKPGPFGSDADEEPADRWPPEQPESLEPNQIAGIYRELRKAREDSKDEPGAADFYYGEMEMRRRSGPWAERVILWLYWLVAGYGLRAGRALIALFLTIVLAAIPLALWGFHPERSYGRALLFSLESSISLLHAPDAKLSAGGEIVQIVLRLAGPLCFGLALLSLRGRVKR